MKVWYNVLVNGHLRTIVPTIFAVFVFGFSIPNAIAQESVSVLYVPLIGITSVPAPLSLPTGGGTVTYNYAVKNFLREVPLTDINVSDDTCSAPVFVDGDDNGDAMLDYDETWRYTCTTRLTGTTHSVSTATGTANRITASHQANATVVVGSDTVPPLVSIINVTKVASPLSLPAQGGEITFTYRVNNPGVVPLRFVTVEDNKCNQMSGKVGDTNGNNLLDTTEVWVYTCATTLTQTTTNTVKVTASANGLTAVGFATITVQVAGSSPETTAQPTNPGLPDTGTRSNAKIFVWAILAGILAELIIFSVLTRKRMKA